MSAVKSSLTGTSAFSICKALYALPLCAAIAFATSAKADPLAGGIGGAIGGAIIGGAVKGKKGVGPGALIGLGVGVAVGAAAEQEKRKRRARKARSKKQHVRHVAPPRYAPSRPAYDGGLVYDTQFELQRLGYNPGPIDGAYGPQTADAIATYQDDYALPITGEPTPDLLFHMRKHDG